MKTKVVLALILLFVIGFATFKLVIKNSKSMMITIGESFMEDTQSDSAVDKVESFDKNAYSITDPSSIWFIANKHYSLPLDYSPTSLVVLDVPLRLAASEQQMRISEVAAPNLTRLFEDSKTAGLRLEFGSGYRSAALQRQFYDSYVAQDGQESADTYSARPGHSEHQTGLALDFTRDDALCHLEACFGELPEGEWLASNAHKYGFVLRYPENLNNITGYTYEPWHYRYIGTAAATEIHKQGIKTLEDFFNLESAPNYQD